VPANKSIFFPTVESHTVIQERGFPLFSFFNPQSTVAKLEQQDQAATVYYQTAQLDDKPIPTYHVKTIFDMVYSPNNLLSSTKLQGKAKTLVDGYWGYLKPLPVGHHTLHMIGMYYNYKSEVTYNINVQAIS
jgi:hypothetical protein